MPYDSAWPQNGQLIDADRFRPQFNALDAKIDAVPAGPPSADGLQGAAGLDGNQGETGPAGPPGAAGEVTNAMLATALASTAANANAVATLDAPFTNDPPTLAEVEVLRAKINELHRGTAAVVNWRREASLPVPRATLLGFPMQPISGTTGIDAPHHRWHSGGMRILRTLFLMALGAAAWAEDDGKLTIAIPSSVQATIAREKGDAGTVRDFRKVNETDGTSYVIGIVVQGKTWELSLDASGRVMRKRLDTGDDGPRMLRLEALPANVRDTMQREAGAGVLGEIEFVEQKTRYISETKIGKRKYRIEVDADGVLLNKEFLGEED